MSEPRLKYENPFHGIAAEIISAMSALNMPPKPMTNPHGDFLSQSDHWVEHAMTHLHEAMNLHRKVEENYNNALSKM